MTTEYNKERFTKHFSESIRAANAFIDYNEEGRQGFLFYPEHHIGHSVYHVLIGLMALDFDYESKGDMETSKKCRSMIIRAQDIIAIESADIPFVDKMMNRYQEIKGKKELMAKFMADENTRLMIQKYSLSKRSTEKMQSDLKDWIRDEAPEINTWLIEALRLSKIK